MEHNESGNAPSERPSEAESFNDLETRLQNGQRSFENSVKESIRRTLATATIISLMIGSLAGAFFGFMAGKTIDKPLPEIVQDIKDGSIIQDKDNVATKGEQTSLAEEEAAVIQVVDQKAPAVVSIVITKDVPRMEQFFSNPFFDDPFFNPFGFRQRREPVQPETQQQEIGGGTGFIIDPNGYIVTNKHVVEDAQADYTVIMNDGKKMQAKVLARDPFNDMAIIKVDAKDLPTIELGTSDNLKIGQTVIAIGNSLGEFRNTVSKGIISGLKREVSAGDGLGQSELLEEVIQTDAAINPGNSGGPLLNLHGQVVGINVAMAQGAQNIGFAIPIDQVKSALDNVRQTGKISRPYLGIRYVVIDKQIRQENSLPVDYGALVIRGTGRTELAVVPGSPADKAGIVENDIILEIDGKKINAENDISKLVRTKKVGDEVELKVWSKGSERTVKVRLEEAN